MPRRKKTAPKHRYRELTHEQDWELTLGHVNRRTARYFPECSDFGHSPECPGCPSHFDTEADRQTRGSPTDDIVLNPGSRPYGWWLYEGPKERKPKTMTTREIEADGGYLEHLAR